MASGKTVDSPKQAAFFHPGVGYAALFIIAVLLSTTLIVPGYPAAQKITIAVTTALGNLLGLAMSSSGEVLTVNGFAMKIIGPCTALNYAVILALAILLYTRHSILYRLQGVVAATCIIVLTNAIRLIVTGLAGTVSPLAFQIMHEYLWVAVFALLIFGLWKVWADRSLNLTKELVHKIILTAVGCVATYIFLVMCREWYCRLLAMLATPLFKMLLGDAKAAILWNGRLVYQQGGKMFSAGAFFELANVSVYVGLMLPYLRCNRKAVPTALLGLVVLVVMYAEFIAVLGMDAVKRGVEAAQLFQLIGSGIFLALPMAVYWLVTGMVKEKMV
jgi:exosortase/archaeosortase family protein